MRKAVALTVAAAMALSLAACGAPASESTAESTAPAETGEEAAEEAPAEEAPAAEGGAVANKDKPVIWFNRQPSNSTTGELDMDALNFNANTYYVGFDANQGAELQGHNDSIARTRGVRSALGTAVDGENGVVSDPVGTNADGSATVVQDGTIEAGGTSYTVRELASQEMKTSAGATWDAPTAGNAISTWAASFGDQIDIVISNNDGMGMAMFNAWSQAEGVPTFGYDANADAVAAIADGYGGTISQHADVQAYLTLRLIRNALDGVDINTGIAEADDAGNVLSEDVYYYDEASRSYYALNVAVTEDNYEEFLDSTVPYAPVANQLDATAHPEKTVWLDIYNAADNFLSATYQPLLQNYDDLLNLKVDYIGGDGQTEANITNRLGNPSAYDAFAINMVKTDNAASYTTPLSQ